MKQRLFTFWIATSIMFSCTMEKETGNTDTWKQEILETEKAFAEMAREEGISNAFLAYAAEEAVLMRNNTLIIGKEEMKKVFERQSNTAGKTSLTWAPDFVDVSSSGDLGYTYGKYQYSFTDSTGNVQLDSGIFHTVWKRQPDGKWRFVWD